MATTTVLSTDDRPAGREFARLKAESQRLRREMLCSGLEISYTMATFSEARHSGSFEESCRNAARKTFSRLRRMLPCGVGDEELAEKLERLRTALQREPACAGEVKHEPVRIEIGRNVDHSGGVSLDPLTRRETEVLKYIAQGNSTKKVAEILGITFKTAACHRYRVMDKLGIHETANLVRYAIRHGMVEP